MRLVRAVAFGIAGLVLGYFMAVVFWGGWVDPVDSMPKVGKVLDLNLWFNNLQNTVMMLTTGVVGAVVGWRSAAPGPPVE